MKNEQNVKSQEQSESASTGLLYCPFCAGGTYISEIDEPNGYIHCDDCSVVFTFLGGVLSEADLQRKFNEREV